MLICLFKRLGLNCKIHMKFFYNVFINLWNIWCGGFSMEGQKSHYTFHLKKKKMSFLFFDIVVSFGWTIPLSSLLINISGLTNSVHQCVCRQTDRPLRWFIVLMLPRPRGEINIHLTCPIKWKLIPVLYFMPFYFVFNTLVVPFTQQLLYSCHGLWCNRVNTRKKKKCLN